jgi:hypothetical protein
MRVNIAHDSYSGAQASVRYRLYLTLIGAEMASANHVGGDHGASWTSARSGTGAELDTRLTDARLRKRVAAILHGAGVRLSRRLQNGQERKLGKLIHPSAAIRGQDHDHPVGILSR